MASPVFSKFGLIYEIVDQSNINSVPDIYRDRFGEVNIVGYPAPGKGKAADKSYWLNEALASIQQPWVLWLREGEKLDWESLKTVDLEQNCTIRAVLTHNKESFTFTHIETRLFPRHHSLAFKGSIYPSVEPAVKASNYGISSRFFTVYSKPVQIKVDFSNEPAIKTGLDYLACGLAKLSRQENEQAITFIKRAIDKNDLFESNLVAAYNTLASIYHDQKNRKLCTAAIEKSLSISTMQRTPYLLLTKLHENKKQWKEAYDALYSYLKVLAEGSMANFDSIMPLAETHYLLGKLAYQANLHDHALVHYQEFYDLKRKHGDRVHPDVLETLLSYAIQLENQSEAEKYFMEYFANTLERKLTNEEWKILDRKLALFQDKEWFGFVLKIYKKIFAKNQENKNIVRRWVAVLIKQGKIEEAQKLISEHNSFIS